jgi:hypothetical protein
MANRRVDAGGSILLIMQKCHARRRRIEGERAAGAAEEISGLLQIRHMEGRIHLPARDQLQPLSCADSFSRSLPIASLARARCVSGQGLLSA